MAEGLATLEGEQLDIDGTEAAFAAVMAAPPADKPGLAAPAKRPPMPEADPETAPHGWTFDGGEWRPKKAPGRKAAPAEKPRVVDGQAPAAAKPKTAAKPAGPAKDYRKVVAENLESIWFSLATVPIPETAFGFQLGPIRTRLRVQAALIEQNGGGLVNGTAILATHNRFVAQAVDRLSTGESGLWILQVAAALAPFVAATAQLWTGRLGSEEELEKMAAKTEQDAEQWVQVQMQAAAA